MRITGRIIAARARSVLAMLLYDSGISGNCYKVRLLFAHLGIEYERQELSVARGRKRR